MRFERYVHQLTTFYRHAEWMPSFSEIGMLTGLRSKNAVAKLGSQEGRCDEMQ